MCLFTFPAFAGYSFMQPATECNRLPNWIVMANSNSTNTFKPRLDWQDHEIIYDFRAQLQGTGSRSDVFRYEYMTILVIMPPPIGGIMRWSASVRPSDVAYIGSNSKTKRPRKTKLGTGVPQVTCDSHTDIKVKRSKVKVTGRGHIVAAT